MAAGAWLRRGGGLLGGCPFGPMMLIIVLSVPGLTAAAAAVVAAAWVKNGLVQPNLPH